MTGARWIEGSIAPPQLSPELWTTDTLALGGRELRLVHPREPDRLLDDQAVHAASRADDYMPYWAYLWPASPVLADFVLRAHDAWPAGTRALELGCGLGLVGLAALARGLDLTFSDYSPAALATAAHNARENGFRDFATLLLDWRTPPPITFPLVLGADVLYEKRCLPQILDVLEAMLAPGGVALLSDPFRVNAEPFAELAGARGFHLEMRTHAVLEPGDRRTKARIYRLGRRADPPPHGDFA